MNQEEVAKLIGLVKLRYPHAKLGLESADPERAMAGMVQVWHMSLADVPFEDAQRVLAEWFKTEKWAPDPSEIRTAVAEDILELPDPEEAWAIARAAMRQYYPGIHAAGAMPEAVRLAVNAIGEVHNLCMSDNPSRDREAFIRSYKVYRKREMEETILDQAAIEPGNVRALRVGGA